MKTVKVKAFIHWVPVSDLDGKPRFEVWRCNMNGFAEGAVFVGETEIDYVLPEGFDPRVGQLKTLRERRAQIVDQFSIELKRIDEKIAKLEAIEWSPT